VGAKLLAAEVNPAARNGECQPRCGRCLFTAPMKDAANNTPSPRLRRLRRGFGVKALGLGAEGTALNVAKRRIVGRAFYMRGE